MAGRDWGNQRGGSRLPAKNTTPPWLHSALRDSRKDADKSRRRAGRDLLELAQCETVRLGET
jgi:hypothetical protein